MSRIIDSEASDDWVDVYLTSTANCDEAISGVQNELGLGLDQNLLEDVIHQYLDKSAYRRAYNIPWGKERPQKELSRRIQRGFCAHMLGALRNRGRLQRAHKLTLSR